MSYDHHTVNNGDHMLVQAVALRVSASASVRRSMKARRLTDMASSTNC